MQEGSDLSREGCSRSAIDFVVLIQATEGGEPMALDGALSFKLYAICASGERRSIGMSIPADEQRSLRHHCPWSIAA